MKIYIVQKGDKASEIAAKHGVSLSALKNLNTQLSDPDKLKPGMKIKVPTESKPVLRKPKVVKKETMEEVRLTNDPVDETSSEEPSTLQTFSGNTYTYKIPQDSNTIYPFNEGEEGAFPNLEGTVPMMEDPYPNAIKEKEKPAPVPYYGNPNQGPYPNANPYTNPYYYPPQTPTYYGQPGFPAPKGGSTGGYGYSPGMPTGN
ncbi:MAG TPA: LysM peptidoglycan-binding domain-containing protein, partial [Candidatus Angelobacter sp.]|nr:LysM peptidoglycan-binding domain-containing protein [Candidatus Angelobacter sp.]